MFMTKSRSREAAKFLAGVAANETIGHWWLGLWGRELLPLKLPWFSFTERANTIVMIVWPIVLIGLVYYAWMRKARVEAV
jgi:hypothetical protein